MKNTAFLSSFLGVKLHQSSSLEPCNRQSEKSSWVVTRASSLEDSKRRARSKYDNIPDLNEQYIAELGWIERKYGRERLGGKDLMQEAQKSITFDERRRGHQIKDGAEDESQLNKTGRADLTGYRTIRNRLLGDTAFVGGLGLCASWAIGDIRDVTSFALGVGSALVYVILLSRSVDRIADAAREIGQPAADPLQPARVGLLAVTVIGAARNADRFSVLAVILGFLTYKMASLLPLLTGEAYE